MSAMGYAVGIGVAPIILAFVAGFFGVAVPLGWPVYIAWFVAAVVAGGAVLLVRSRS